MTLGSLFESPNAALTYRRINMNDAIAKLTGWITKLTDLLISLVVFGIIVGILFNDPFGVIAGVGNLFSQIGDNGLAGLLVLYLVYMMYPNK